MFIDISDKILKNYGRPEEYLIDHYPQNYFDYYIDIGARGTLHPWHVNNIAKNNPNTVCVAYEPDLPYIKELESATKDSKNVYCNSVGYGVGNIKIPDGTCDSVSLSDIVNQYEVDVNSNWAIKFDCEGCEYNLMNLPNDVNILRQASHISLEFHTKDGGKNFFTMTNSLPDNFNDAEEWMKKEFSETHKIFLTSGESGLRTYALLKNKIISEANDLFWKNLLP